MYVCVCAYIYTCSPILKRTTTMTSSIRIGTSAALHSGSKKLETVRARRATAATVKKIREKRRSLDPAEKKRTTTWSNQG